MLVLEEQARGLHQLPHGELAGRMRGGGALGGGGGGLRGTVREALRDVFISKAQLRIIIKLERKHFKDRRHQLIFIKPWMRE